MPLARRRPFLALALALLALAAPVPAPAQEAPAAAPAAAAQAPADPGAATRSRTVDVGSGLPERAAPPRTLRDHAHVFAAFAIAWLLLFGYTVSIGRRWARVERELASRG